MQHSACVQRRGSLPNAAGRGAHVQLAGVKFHVRSGCCQIMKVAGFAIIALGYATILSGAAVQAAGQSIGSVGVSTNSPSDRNRCINVMQYGADNSGAQDNGPAFQSAIAASDPRAICLYFPAGTYRFATSPTVALRSGSSYRSAAITIVGDGSELSRLQPDANINGLTLSLNGSQQSFHIRDLSILAGNKSRSATGLSILQANAFSPNPAQSDISDLSIHGKDGFNADDRFARGIYLYQISNVSLTNIAIVGSSDGAPYASNGTCLSMEGSSVSIAVQINIISSQINSCQYGIHYGDHVQGLQIIATNFVGNETAIYQPNKNNGNDQISIIGSQFNSGLRNILLETAIDGVSICGNFFYLSEIGSASIEMPGVQFSIQGNSFVQFGTARATAISIGAYLLDAGSITGNSFDNFNTAIVLQNNSERVNIQSNAYSNTVSKVINRGKNNILGGGSL